MWTTPKVEPLAKVTIINDEVEWEDERIVEFLVIWLEVMNQ